MHAGARLARERVCKPQRTAAAHLWRAPRRHPMAPPHATPQRAAARRILTTPRRKGATQ